MARDPGDGEATGAKRVLETGIALVHKGDRIWAEPEAQAEFAEGADTDDPLPLSCRDRSARRGPDRGHGRGRPVRIRAAGEAAQGDGLTVHVHIPTRIRVDPEAVAERQGCIEEALSQAVLRALRRSFQVVLEERGGPRKVACHRAEFTWTGAAMDRVDATVRRSLEERIANAFSEAADKAGVPDSTHITGRPMDARPRAVEEIVDPDRFSSALGL